MFVRVQGECCGYALVRTGCVSRCLRIVYKCVLVYERASAYRGEVRGRIVRVGA